MAKIVVLSPPKYLKMVNTIYTDKYHNNLMKAFEKELNSKGGDAAKFAVGMKLEPYETIAALIKTSTKKGLGTRPLLLISCIVRYQDLMGHVSGAYKKLFGESIHKRIKDNRVVVERYSKDVLIGLLDKTSLQVEEEDLKPSPVPGIENLVEEVPQVPKVSFAPTICTPIIPVAPPSAPAPPSVVSPRSFFDNVADAVVADTFVEAVADKILEASVETVVDAVTGALSSEVPNPSSGGVEGDIVVDNTSSSRKTITIEDMNRKFDRDLYFWNSTEHCYLGGGITNPSLKKDKGDYNKWQIKRIDDQTDVVEEINRVIIIHRNVAIYHVATGKYLSCRRSCHLGFGKFALAEFRKERTKYESFEMIYASDHSCIFKSHNDLFLAINQTFHTGEFKSCRNRDGDDGRPLKGRWNCDENFTRTGTKDTTGRIIRKSISFFMSE